MNELYWIGRFGSINEVAGIFCALTFLVAFVMMFLVIVGSFDSDLIDEDKQRTLNKCLKCSVVTCIITGLLYIFVSSKEEAYFILGVGGAIDYVQNSEVAKELPDKCVNAISEWVDSMSEGKENGQ